MQIFRAARRQCTCWWADVLGIVNSRQRQPINVEFESAVARYRYGDYFTFLMRDNDFETHWEIGYRTGGAGPYYFLWIVVEPHRMTSLMEMKNEYDEL